MSAWRSEAPVTETLGEDEPAPSRARWVTVALALIGLVAAFALGVETHGVSIGGVALGVDPPRLAAGGLRAGPSDGAATGFVLPVRNAGPDTVDVAVAALPGVELERTPSVPVDPDVWTEVPFSVRVDCDEDPVPPARTVTLAGGEAGQVQVDLAEAAVIISDLRAARCTPQQSLTRRRLMGVWLLERAYGRWSSLAGRHVLQFRRDGSFLADPEGVRFVSHRGVLGRYRLRGPFLEAVQQGFVGYACLPGERAVWHSGQLPDDRIVLTFVRGRNCPAQPGELWVLRRLAR